METENIDPAELLRMASEDTRSALRTLQERRTLVGRDDPVGRDVSIAITHLEDALLRLTVGTPS